MTIQGHRGARGLRPENTIPAFEYALSLGVPTLEMDVVIARDATVVVSHEPWFSAQICSHPGGGPVTEDEERSLRIFAMTYEEVAQFDCGRRGHPLFPRQQAMLAVKPRLRDVLRHAEAYAAERGLPPVRYNIETKSQPEGDGHFHPDPVTFTRLLYDVLAAEQVVERTMVQSFDDRTLRVARRLDPAWTTSLLVSLGGDAGIAANLRRLGFTPEVYSPDHRLVDAALVRTAREMGMRVIPWTVNQPAEMRRLAGLGVEGFITDYPDVAAAEGLLAAG